MKYRKYGRYSIAGWLNQIFLQWFFIRLQLVIDCDHNDNLRIKGIEAIFPIVPLTGWWSGYIPQKFWTIRLI